MGDSKQSPDTSYSNVNTFLLDLSKPNSRDGTNNVRLELGAGAKVSIGNPSNQRGGNEGNSGDGDAYTGATTIVKDVAAFAITKRAPAITVGHGAEVLIGDQNLGATATPCQPQNEQENATPKRRGRMTEQEKGERMLMSLQDIIRRDDIKDFARFFGISDEAINRIDHNTKNNANEFVHQMLRKIVENKKPTAAAIFATVKDKRGYQLCYDHMQRVFLSLKR